MLAREFLDLAKILAEKDRPAELRSALGRAYYALYNSAVDCQKMLGFDFHTGYKSGQNHSLVRNRFSYVLTDDITDLFNDMKDLHDMRKCADYDLLDADVEDSETVKAHLEIAEEAINLVESIMTSPNRAAIIQEMRDWEARNRGRLPTT